MWLCKRRIENDGFLEQTCGARGHLFGGSCIEKRRTVRFIAHSILGKALDQFRLDTGHYPTNEEGLISLVARPPNEPKWDGPYLTKDVPADPWGNPYVFKNPGEHGEYDLLSYGKDGKPGGEGEAADVTNW